MRAAVADRPGPLADVVTVRTVPEPGPPGPTELTVRMTATTANPSDVVTVSGAYPSRTTFPLVPGFEGIGVIEDIENIGWDVPSPSRGLVGRRVLPLGGAGCWQQRRTVDYSWCITVPDDLDDRTACFSYINPLTASLMVTQYCRGARSVAVTAATSAIAGHLAELLTETTGLRPVGLVRGTPGSTVADPDRWAGVISTADPDWRSQLRSAVPEGAVGPDVILDCIGGTLGSDLVEALAPGGTMVLYGLLSGTALPMDCFDGRGGTRVEMFRLRDTVHSLPRGDLAGLFTPVFDLQRRGLLHTPVAAETGLDGLPGLLGAGTGVGSGRGKILIDPWA